MYCALPTRLYVQGRADEFVAYLQEQIPAPCSKPNGLQALRHSEQMSAFTAVPPKLQMTACSEDQRPRVSQREVK